MQWLTLSLVEYLSLRYNLWELFCIYSGDIFERKIYDKDMKDIFLEIISIIYFRRS